MTRKPKIFAAALPLSVIPELRELLAPFLGGGGKRGHVVMVRLGDEAIGRLDQLVEAGVAGSRSEAAAFLVGAGIQAQEELLGKIRRESEEIRKIRSALRERALEALRSAAGGGRKGHGKKTPRRTGPA